jgi:hypothetical protein
MKKLTEEWLKAAEDDLRVIERIGQDEHLTHMVAFHAQQAVEKSLLEAKTLRFLLGCLTFSNLHQHGYRFYFAGLPDQETKSNKRPPAARPLTALKCTSKLMTASLCCSAVAAIHMSFEGMGCPIRRKSR